MSCEETSEMNDSIYDDWTRNLAQKQNLRRPNHLIFLVDNKAIYIKKEQLGERVKVLRAFKLTFDNAISYLENHQVFNKNSLFIFCCGISSLLKWNVIAICKKMKCSKPLMKYSVDGDISSDVIISKALKLQEDILNKTCNDQIMFCEIIPINIFNDLSQCSNNHTFQNNISSDLYAKYLKTIEEYNRFANYHSRHMGFKSLNLLTTLFTNKVISYTEDCFNDAVEIDEENASNYITKFLIELLRNIDQVNDNLSITSTSTTTDNENAQQKFIHSEVESHNVAKKANEISKDSYPIQNDKSSSDNITNTDKKSNEISSSEIDKMSNICSRKNSFEEHASNLKLDVINIEDDETINKQIERNNLHQCDADSVDEDRSENIHSIPGVSYIIALRKEVKESEFLVSYDCMLCDPEKSTCMSDSELKSHIRSRQHILNVLEIENFSLYKEYKNNWIISSSFLLKLHNDVTTSKSDSTTVKATLKTYDEIRKQLSFFISQSRRIHNNQRLNEELCSRSDKTEERLYANERSNSPGPKDTVVSYTDSLQRIANIQKKHCPNQIVFALDGRDFYLNTEKLDQNVKVARTIKLTFDNAIPFLDHHDVLGKGSLIIFCCAIYSVLVANVVNICKKKKCQNHLMRYSVNQKISGDILILKALKLQEYILSNTTNDQVMFCEIVPINISSDVRRCDNKHTFQNFITEDMFGAYLKTIEEFNKFVRDHSRYMGFKHLDLMKNSFPTRQEVSLSFASRNDLYDLDKEYVSNYVLGYTRELLENIKCCSKDHIKDNITNMPSELEDLSVHAEKIFYSELSSCIPGVAYIIAFKDTTIGEEIPITYDCVLCSSTPKPRLYIADIKTHINTKEHLLNVMEVDFYEMYKKFKNLKEATPISLYTAICARGIQMSSSRVVSTPERYDRERKNLVRKVSQLRQGKTETQDIYTTGTVGAVIAIEDKDHSLIKIDNDPLAALTVEAEASLNIVDKNVIDRDDAKFYEKNRSNDFKYMNERKLMDLVSILYKPLLNITSSSRFESHLSKETVKRTFKKVVFITYQQYAEYMNEFRVPWVEVVVINPNDCEGLVSLIKKMRETESSSILYLTHSGILNISRMKYSEWCIHSSCLHPLNILFPFDENLIKFEDLLIDIHHYYASLTEEVNSILDLTSLFLILPPLPPTIYIIEEEKHFTYHEMEQNRFYFVTQKTFHQLQMLFTVFSKEVTMLSISELENKKININAIEDYFNLTKIGYSFVRRMTYDKFIDPSNVSLNTPLQEWYKTVLNFIFQCVSVEDTPCTSGTYHSTRTFEGIKGPVASQTIKNFPETSSSSLNKNVTGRYNKNTTYQYDHIVFICLEEQLDLLSFKEWNTKYISVVETESHFDWTTIKAKLDSLKLLASCEKILVAVLGNIRLLANVFYEPICIRLKCENPLSIYNVARNSNECLFDTKMNNVKNVLNQIKAYFKENSEIILFPLFPINCVKYPEDSKKNQHNNIHESSLKTGFPCLIKGRRNLINQLVYLFNLKWRTEMFNSLSDCEELKELIIQHFPKHFFPVKWWNRTSPKSREFRDSEDFLYRSCKFFLRIFITKVCPSASHKLTFKAETFFGLFMIGDDSPQNRRLDMSHVQECTNNSQLKKYSTSKTRYCYEENMNHCISQFLKKASRKNGVNPFDTAYLIGKAKLSNLFDTFENIHHIPFDFSDVFEEDIINIKQMLGNIKKNSACFVAFELPVLVEEVLVSPGCNKFGCDKLISAYNLSVESVENNSDEIINKAFVMNKIAELMSFVTKLSDILPVIILPFFPSTIYCDDGYSYIKHKLSHVITKSDSYVVIGNKELWEMYDKFVTNIWSVYLQLCYENYFSSENFLSYIKEYSKFLMVETSLRKLTTACSEIFKWKSIVRALLELLVLKESSVQVMQEVEDCSIDEIAHNDEKESSCTQNQALKDNEIIVIELDSSHSSSRSRSRSLSNSQRRNYDNKSRKKNSPSRSERCTTKRDFLYRGSRSKSRDRNRYRSGSQHKRSSSKSRRRSYSINRSERFRSRPESRSRNRSKSPSRSKRTGSSKRSSIMDPNMETPSSSIKKRNRSPSFTQYDAKRKTVRRSPSPEAVSYVGTQILTDFNLQEVRPLQPDSIMLMLGQNLFTEFNEEKAKLKFIHEREYDAYHQSPELHSSFENYYEEFCSEFQELSSQSENEQGWEELWEQFWNRKIEIIKDLDWNRKLKILVNMYKLKSKLLDSEKLDTSATLSDFGGQFSVVGDINKKFNEISNINNFNQNTSVPMTFSTASSNQVSSMEPIFSSLTENQLYNRLFTSNLKANELSSLNSNDGSNLSSLKLSGLYPSSSKEIKVYSTSSNFSSSKSSFVLNNFQPLTSKTSGLNPSSSKGRLLSSSSEGSNSNHLPSKNSAPFSLSAVSDVDPVTSCSLQSTSILEFLDLQSQNNMLTGKFTVVGALNLLEQVSDKLGMLGPAMMALSKSAKDLGPNSREALKLFVDEDNLVLLNMAIKKLERLIISSSQAEMCILSKALNWIVQLIDYAKNSLKLGINLNLNALAIASLNKSANDTLNLIIKAFRYEGKSNPTKEEINEVYLKICSLRLEVVEREQQ